MSKVYILSIFLLSSFIVISLASWDAPVQTIEKEETIPIPHNSHTQQNGISVISSSNDDEVKENRVDPVLIVTSTSSPASSSPNYCCLSSFQQLLLLVMMLPFLHAALI